MARPACTDVEVTAHPPSTTVRQGFFAHFTVSATDRVGPLSLSATGVPAGSQVMFTPTTVTRGGSSGVLLMTGFRTPPGTYPVTVRATSLDGRSGTTTFTLTVTRFGTVALRAS